MSSHTLSLSVFILICAAFPAQLFRLTVAGALGGGGAGSAAGSGSRGLARFAPLIPAAGLLVVAALVWAVTPADGVLTAPQGWYWLAVAVAFGVLAPGWEIGLGALIAKARRRRISRVALHGRVGPVTVAAVTGAVLIALAEEVLFRGVGLHLLREVLGWPAVAAVGLTAVVYGLNHLYFGWLTVGQKVLTGVGFGLLYLLAGESVLVPATAHVVQNLVVLALLPRWLGAR
jgi:membrane protease YdiL (CAAX protease family)